MNYSINMTLPDVHTSHSFPATDQMNQVILNKVAEGSFTVQRAAEAVLLPYSLLPEEKQWPLVLLRNASKCPRLKP